MLFIRTLFPSALWKSNQIWDLEGCVFKFSLKLTFYVMMFDSDISQLIFEVHITSDGPH
jgi:hypothetical protein